MSEITLEWAPFTLAEGASEAELLAASDALQSEFLERQDGFLRRELLHGGGRRWCDLVYWRDARAAEQAVEKAAGSEVCYRYFQLMVGADAAHPGAGVQHFALRRRYRRRAAPAEAPAPPRSARKTAPPLISLFPTAWTDG